MACPFDHAYTVPPTLPVPVSLEMPVGDEGESELGQFIADEHALSPYDQAAGNLAHEALAHALGRLNHRERRILALRYGLEGEHPRTLDDVGRMVQRHPRADTSDRESLAQETAAPS